MSWFAVLIISVFCMAGCDPSGGSRRGMMVEIPDLLKGQAGCWNTGDLEGFMDCYWSDEDLTFSVGGKTSRGWQVTLDRYRRSYPTSERMGHLVFEDVEIIKLASNAALALGRWRIERKDEVQAGNFSLVWKKVRGRWLIIHDHTSADSDPQSGS